MDRREMYGYGYRDEVSDQTYNMVLGATVIYGLVVNVLLCAFATPFALSLNPIVLLVGYIVCVLAGSALANRSDNPAVSFAGYNLICVPVGLVVSISVYWYGGLDSALVYQAFLYTLIISGTMLVLASIYPSFFARMGGLLFGGLIGILISELVLRILGISQIYTSLFAAILFSVYIGYDVVRAQRMPKTVDNAVDSAVHIYLDIINLFLRILRILSRSRSRN